MVIFLCYWVVVFMMCCVKYRFWCCRMCVCVLLLGGCCWLVVFVLKIVCVRIGWLL